MRPFYETESKLAISGFERLRGRAMIEEFDRLHGRPDLLAAFIRHARIPVRLQRLSG